MKKFANGVYQVTITAVTSCVSEVKKTSYYLVKFESADRYHEERIYQSGNFLKLIKYLYFKAGIKSNKYTCLDLIGVPIGVQIGTGACVKNDGKIITFPKIENYLSLDEIYELDTVNNEDCVEENHPDSMDNSDYADIFGVNLNQMASDMGIDRCNIHPGLIMEYAGY